MKPAELLDCNALAAELVGQREFFEFHRDDLPEHKQMRPDLALARYSGERCDDEQVNLRVGAMRLLRMSDRAVERECGVDRRTIPYRLAWLERAGRIPALKERLSLWSGSLAESSALVLACLLDRANSGEISADLASMIRSVGTAYGITAEKFQLLTGGATERIEVSVGAGRAETEQWCRANAIQVEVIEPGAAPTDVKATGDGAFVGESGQVEARRHGADTSEARRTRRPRRPGDHRGGAIESGGGAKASMVSERSKILP